MRWRLAGLILVVALAALLLPAQLRRLRSVDALQRQLHDARTAVTVWQARYAESASQLTRTDTVWREARARVDTLRDSIPVWRHDTTYIHEYVTRTDAALHACTELASACELFHQTADSTIAAVSTERDSYHALYDASRRRWWDRFGVMAGYDPVTNRPALIVGLTLWP